jgi:hypothetical protein
MGEAGIEQQQISIRQIPSDWMGTKPGETDKKRYGTQLGKPVVHVETRCVAASLGSSHSGDGVAETAHCPPRSSETGHPCGITLIHFVGGFPAIDMIFISSRRSP